MQKIISVQSSELKYQNFISCLSVSYFFTEVWWWWWFVGYNAVLASGVQHSDSVTHTYILFHILFPYKLLQILSGVPPGIYSKSLLTILFFIYISVYMLMPNY